MELVFDPRYQAFHDHDRSTFAALRGQQRRLAYGLARIGPIKREGLHKRVLSRLPVHYFTLVRLLPIYRRIRRSPVLGDRGIKLHTGCRPAVVYEGHLAVEPGGPVPADRVVSMPQLRGPFLRNVPRLVAAEWTLGASALRYALRRPPLRGQAGGGFR